mmetsp:Transcript_41268/g.127455  ORF Transcript_41268/g.127455 Transcript_41268/m.127455 type:complete len:370 (-) Transcript_41268:175-1284(-)
MRLLLEQVALPAPVPHDELLQMIAAEGDVVAGGAECARGQGLRADREHVHQREIAVVLEAVDREGAVGVADREELPRRVVRRAADGTAVLQEVLLADLEREADRGVERGVVALVQALFSVRLEPAVLERVAQPLLLLLFEERLRDGVLVVARAVDLRGAVGRLGLEHRLHQLLPRRRRALPRDDDVVRGDGDGRRRVGVRPEARHDAAAVADEVVPHRRDALAVAHVAREGGHLGVAAGDEDAHAVRRPLDVRDREGHGVVDVLDAVAPVVRHDALDGAAVDLQRALERQGDEGAVGAEFDAAHLALRGERDGVDRELRAEAVEDAEAAVADAEREVTVGRHGEGLDVAVARHVRSRRPLLQVKHGQVV